MMSIIMSVYLAQLDLPETTTGNVVGNSGGGIQFVVESSTQGGATG